MRTLRLFGKLVQIPDCDEEDAAASAADMDLLCAAPAADTAGDASASADAAAPAPAPTPNMPAAVLHNTFTIAATDAPGACDAAGPCDRRPRMRAAAAAAAARATGAPPRDRSEDRRTAFPTLEPGEIVEDACGVGASDTEDDVCVRLDTRCDDAARRTWYGRREPTRHRRDGTHAEDDRGRAGHERGHDCSEPYGAASRLRTFRERAKCVCGDDAGLALWCEMCRDNVYVGGDRHCMRHLPLGEIGFNAYRWYPRIDGGRARYDMSMDPEARLWNVLLYLTQHRATHHRSRGHLRDRTHPYSPSRKSSQEGTCTAVQ